MFSLLFAFGSSIYNYKWLDDSAKIFCVYLGYTLIAECIATYSAIAFHNNLPVYAIYNLGEIVLMAMYFNYNIVLFKRYNVGFYIAGIGLLLGIPDVLFFEGVNSIDAYFMFFEGFCIIGMCLVAFFTLLMQPERIDLRKYPHFWIISIVLLYRSVTYIYWGLYDVFLVRLGDDMFIIYRSILALNIICYSIIGVLYLLYPKMQKINE